MHIYDIISSIFEIENIEQKLNHSKQKRSITSNDLIFALCKSEPTLAKDLNVSETTLTRTTKYLWPEKPTTGLRLRNYLLHKYYYKYCSNCDSVKESSEFSNNKARPDGLNSHCRDCCLDTRREYQQYYQAGVRAAKLLRTPKWSETSKIKEFYDNCPAGFHVDHVVPLQGELVSGLHVLSNLQYLPALDNLRKSNSFEIE